MTYYMPELVAPGKRVLSYPDHLFNVRTGTIVEADDNYLQVEYEGYGRCSIRRRSGRLWSDSIDTSLDIQMIDQDEDFR